MPRLRHADLRNRYCYAAVCLAPELFAVGVGIEAFVLLVRYVFQCWEFRKIYLDAPAINYEQYKSGEKLGLFDVEGVLKDHMFVAGRFWDQYLLAVTRDHVESLMASPLGTLFRPATTDGKSAQPVGA